MGELREKPLMKIKDVAGAILAGGKSKRFGSDKRFFKLGDKTFIEIMCEKLLRVFESCYLSVEKNFNKIQKPEIKIISQFKIVYDKYDEIGPVGGLISVLHEIPHIGCVFVPVDVPFLDEKVLIFLSQNREFDIVYFNLNGKIYPIPGYYSKNLITFIGEMISEGNFSLKNLIAKWDGKKLEIDHKQMEELGINPQSMININQTNELGSLR